jgi:hypothetical protein
MVAWRGTAPFLLALLVLLQVRAFLNRDAG